MRSSRSSTPEALAIAGHFESLRDPRRGNALVHPFLNILVIAIAGVICGVEGWDELAAFGEAKAHWFETFLDLEAGIPSPDTFRRVFALLRPKDFNACLTAWVQSLATSLDGKVVAIDGKTLRGAFRRSIDGTPLHLVHVWAVEQRLLIAQKAVDGAPGETAAIAEILGALALEKAVVTTDAGSCSAATAQAIIDAGADYALHLKANRKDDYDHVVALFEAREAGGYAAPACSVARFGEVAHGRGEARTVVVLTPKRDDRLRARWPGLKTVAMSENVRVTATGVERDRHFYVLSLEARAAVVAGYLRAHWGVENQLHWILDTQLREDASSIHARNAAENFATLRRIAVMLLRREPSCKLGTRARQKVASWDHDYLLRVLSRGAAET